MKRQLLYEEHHSEGPHSFSVVLLWDTKELTLYSPKGPFHFERGRMALPSYQTLIKWPGGKVSYEDTMQLEELLLMLRLPLSIPTCEILDGTHFRMHLQAGDQILYLEWGGSQAPLPWTPLDELVAFLRDLRKRYATPC